MSKSLVSAKEAGAATPFGAMLTTAGEALAAHKDRRRGAGGRAFDEAREAGYREGYEQGLAEGAQEGERRAFDHAWQARQAMLEDMASSLDASLAAWYVEAERQLAQLATVIAARVIHQELTSNPEAILEITRGAIAEVTHASTARLRVHPMDAPLLQDHVEAITNRAPSLKHVEIADAPTIAGGCVGEPDGGVVEGTIVEVLHRAREAGRQGRGPRRSRERPPGAGRCRGSRFPGASPRSLGS